MDKDTSLSLSFYLSLMLYFSNKSSKNTHFIYFQGIGKVITFIHWFTLHLHTTTRAGLRSKLGAGNPVRVFRGRGSDPCLLSHHSIPPGYTLVGSWIGSRGVTRAQDSPVGIKHPKWQLLLLCPNTQPSMVDLAFYFYLTVFFKYPQIREWCSIELCLIM